MRVFGDTQVLGVRERLGVIPEELFLGIANHLAERVIGRDDPVLKVGKDHRCHVVLEGEAEALVGFESGLLRLSTGPVVTYGGEHP